MCMVGLNLECVWCSKRFIFVNTDACMAAQGVTLGVFEKLKVSPGTYPSADCLVMLQAACC